MNIKVLFYLQLCRPIFGGNFISLSLERVWRLKMEADEPEDLKKALLNSGYSSIIAEKIVTHYTKESESV
jgi:hypothetical protein